MHKVSWKKCLRLDINKYRSIITLPDRTPKSKILPEREKKSSPLQTFREGSFFMGWGGGQGITEIAITLANRLIFP